MSAEEPSESVQSMDTSDTTAESAGEISKKAAKKAAKAAEKAAKKAAHQAERAAASGQSGAAAEEEEEDPLQDRYGDKPRVQSQERTSKVWTLVSDCTADKVGETVLVRARIHSSRKQGKMCFLTLRQRTATVQAILFVGSECSKQMVAYAAGIPKESIVDVEAEVVAPEEKIVSTSQQDVELRVLRVYSVSKSTPDLPFQLEDAARSETAYAGEEQFARVGQDTRLDNRVVDLRTPANNAIFRVQSGVCTLFREFLLGQGFTEIHTPKLIGGTSEGGANVFRLEYFGRNGCLAQSPQLYKQMAVCADLDRVFEIGPVFRAENSFTHRHLCEFVGLDIEMAIKEHYHEVLDVLDKMFLHIFDGLNERFATELKTIATQYPFEPLQYLRPSLILTFPEAVKMLHEAGIEQDPLDDLSTEVERKLGQLVKAKYQTDFFMLEKYPLNARPFYTMPDPNDGNYTNSFDIFIRGEEIISGAQRIHEPEFLAQRAAECGIDVATIQDYIDSFKYGAPPHGGCGVGLERVVMLFCGLNNIRKTSMFPRDPKRLTP